MSLCTQPWVIWLLVCASINRAPKKGAMYTKGHNLKKHTKTTTTKKGQLGAPTLKTGQTTALDFWRFKTLKECDAS